MAPFDPRDERWRPREDAWRWRLRIARLIAAEMEPRRLGVKAVYLFGSTKNADAGRGSDIDLLVHITGDPIKKSRLVQWIDGWDARLCEVLQARGGPPRERLLDVHYVTDEDIAHHESFASHIGAVDDPARRLAVGRSSRARPCRPG